MPIDLGFHFQNYEYLLKYFGHYLLTTVYTKKRYQEFLFVYLQGYSDKSNFSFLKNSAVKPQYILFAKEPFLRKILLPFFCCNILHIEKSPAEKSCKVLEMEIKTYTPISLRLVFEKIKFKVLQYIQHVSIVNAKGSVKIRLACSKAFLPTISSFNIVTHSDGYIKGDKYLFFIKLGAANVLLK